MIYEIDNKYYVKVGYEYNEIEMKLDENGDVILLPLKNRIDGNGKTIKQIIFQDEKDNFKKKLEKKQENKNTTIHNDTDNNKRKYSRWG